MQYKMLSPATEARISLGSIFHWISCIAGIELFKLLNARYSSSGHSIQKLVSLYSYYAVGLVKDTVQRYPCLSRISGPSWLQCHSNTTDSVSHAVTGM